MVEECGQLKAATTKHVEREQELVIENKTLSSRLERADEKIATLNASVVIEHEDGFNKALG